MENNVVKLSDTFAAKLAEAKQRLTDAVMADDMKAVEAITKEMKQIAAAHKRLSAVESMEITDEDETSSAADDIAVIKAHIRANILANDDYYYVHDLGMFLLYREAENEWVPVAEFKMRNHYSELIVGSDYWNAFMEVIKEDGRWFYGRCSSFHPIKGKLNMLRPQLVELQDGTPHPLFDLVVRSLCGDKKENIDHFEKVLVAKHNKPENYLLPVICLSDDGATGKSLFVSKVLTTMFGRSSVFGNAAMSDFAGQFNGHLAGKLAILVNENCEDSYNHNKIKQIAGSPTITYTNKGQMPYEGDNTALLIVTGNSIAGSIRVGGGDVDRRFSLIRGTKKLSTYTSEWLTQDTGTNHTPTMAEQWMVATGQTILSDEIEVGKWLNHLKAKHGSVEHVPALHGADYQQAVAMQTPLWEQCFEVFFRHPHFSYARTTVVYDFYRDEAKSQGNRVSLGKKKFYQFAEEWLAKHEPHIERMTAGWGNSTATVYVNTNVHTANTRPSLNPNDGFWCIPDGSRNEWKVSI